jgi:N-methylhydantoinase B/oxoprolinase/acetone carboxylase alpha subunit
MEEYARYNAAREQAVILARAAAAARNQFARQIENRVEEAEQQALLRLWEKIQRKAVEEFPDINRQLESIYKEAGKRGYGSLKDLDRRILIGLKQHCEVLFNHSDAMLKIAVNNSAVTRREALEVFHNIRYKSAAVATKIEEILKVTGN